MNRNCRPRLIAALPFALLLAACGEAKLPSQPPERDPLVVQALNDQLMVDPDLVGQNLASSAITIETDYSLPTYDPPEAAIRQARSEAAIMVGGGQKLVVPELTEAADRGSHPATGSLADILAGMGAASDCVSKLRYSAGWAARMPELLPVYPYAATQIAAGADGGGCKVRAVNFLSGVSVEELSAFYAARARDRGFRPVYQMAGPSDRNGNGKRTGSATVLSAKRNNAQFRLVLHELGNGLTAADLFTSGL